MTCQHCERHRPVCQKSCVPYTHHHDQTPFGPSPVVMPCRKKSMTNLEYLEARTAKDKAAETYLWQYVDVALPLGEYTQKQREEAVFRMAHNVAVMQYQTLPDQRKP